MSFDVRRAMQRTGFSPQPARDPACLCPGWLGGRERHPRINHRVAVFFRTGGVRPGGLAAFPDACIAPGPKITRLAAQLQVCSPLPARPPDSGS